ncbi:hypothetical protein AB0J74_14905 [Asanoa sp. NPDC049573]|uniref:hypothetical protein n=1 Tax=Asanoa sp. NPDC049573 TaxID=3155396 RepID=UPI0034156B9B
MHHPRGPVVSSHQRQRSLLVTVALVIAGLAIVISLAGIVLAALALGRGTAGAAGPATPAGEVTTAAATPSTW